MKDLVGGALGGLSYGKMLATCAFMTLSLSLTVSAFAIVLQFAGLEHEVALADDRGGCAADPTREPVPGNEAHEDEDREVVDPRLHVEDRVEDDNEHAERSRDKGG